MNKSLKVGVIVRFLNATGGGRVARISKDTAWVEDEDGFEIPTPLNECVVVEEGDTFMPKYKPPTFLNIKEVEHRDTPLHEPKHKLKVEDFEDFDLHNEDVPSEPRRMPHTFLPAKGEFTTYLAIIPQDIRRLGQTSYDCYLINDSTYTMYYVISRGESSKRKLLQHGTLFPEQDSLIVTMASNELNEYECLNIQILAFAENPGIFKEHVSSELKLDLTKLFELHSFIENDFFEDNALILPIRSTQPENTPVADNWTELSKQLQETISQTKVQRNSIVERSKSKGINEPIIVDLHIDALLDTTLGMSNADILSYQIGIFNKTMQAHIEQTGRKLIFIHGKGDGVLRKKLIDELKYRYKHCHHQDASFEQYSYGATQITIGNKRNG